MRSVLSVAVLFLLVAGALLAVSGPPARVVRAARVDAAANPDESCGRCHAAIVASYAKTPMARASGRAEDGLLSGGFVHQPSGIRYAVGEVDGEPTLGYERVVAGTGGPLKGSVRLRYYIGSNTRGRTYLFANEGLWFESPINWYSKRSVWDMAPAYEGAHTMPFTMQVDANCLHCHATGVAASEGARNHFAGEPFAQGGIGCSSCHGDASAHVASGGKTAMLDVAKLAPARRDSVCLQCHLEGDATVYRAGRSLSSFRAGDDLAADAVYFVNQSSAKSRGRASSQYEAMLRSACRRASGDALTCTTCHDPHSSPAPAERVAFFRAKCLQCHTGPAMATAHHPEQQDCATCHMPTRKTTDISHEQLTDHDVEARPGAAAGTLKLVLSDPTAPPVEFLHTAELVPVGGWDAGARERGLAYAQYAVRGDTGAARHAESLLHRAEFDGSADGPVHADLGFLAQRAGHPGEARKEYLGALAGGAFDATAATNLAILDAGEGDAGAAIERLKRVFAEDPSQTASALNLALIECRQGDRVSARAVVVRALAFNPDSAEARAFLSDGRYAGATCSLRP